MSVVARRRIDALDRIAQRTQVLQPRFFELGVQRRHADELEPCVVKAHAGVERPRDGRHRTPELAAEVLSEPCTSFGLQTRDVPAFQWSVAARVFDRGTSAKGFLPCLSVAFKVVQQDAVAIERQKRAFDHVGIIGDA